MKSFYILIVAACCAISVGAQTIIHIQPGARFFIQGNALVNLDGLSLSPSENLELTDMDLTRSESPQRPGMEAHIKRVYQFSSAISNYKGSLRFYYKTEELNDLVEANLQQAIFNGSHWMVMPAMPGGAGNNYVEQAINGLNLLELTLTAAQESPLPLLWGPVRVVCENDKAKLSWETKQEINTSHFVIQRSSDGTSWSDIGTQQAVGNSNESRKYEFVDTDLSAGNNLYYRIKSVDIDGSYEYSIVVTLHRCAGDITMQLYPVPVISTATLSVTSRVPAQATIQVFHISGRMVMQKKFGVQTGQNQIEMNTTGWAPGTYLLKFIQGDSQQVLKFIKQ